MAGKKARREPAEDAGETLEPCRRFNDNYGDSGFARMTM